MVVNTITITLSSGLVTCVDELGQLNISRALLTANALCSYMKFASIHAAIFSVLP